MRALTLWQPWAHIVALGVKRLENRSWPPPQRHMDTRIAIHAGLRWSDDAARAIALKYRVCPGRSEVAFGAIVATAHIEAVVTSAEDAEHFAGKGQGVWFFGPYGWVLSDISKLDHPLPCRGYQGLWGIDEPLAARLDA